ncbi:hypothetical protein ACWA1C_20340 [Flectobacillus roseus]
MNKLVLLIVLFLTGLSLLVDKPTKKTKSPKVEMDSTVRFFLGDSASLILSQSRDIRIFRLGNKEQDSHEGFEGYVIKKNWKIQSITQIDRLKRFLKNGKNYGIDQYVKNCTFNPTVGISVIYRGEHVNILVCPSCQVWRFIYKSNIKEEDFKFLFQDFQSLIQ